MKIQDAHILFVVPVLTGGGAERVVAVLASGLAEKGIKTSVLVNKRCEKEYPISSKVNIYSLPEKYSVSGNLIHKIKKTFARYRVLKSINPDMIIAFLHGVLEPTFLCNIFLRKKFISTIRVNPSISENENLKIRNFIIRCSTACFVQNEEQKRYFSKKIQDKTFIVSNPISDNFFDHNKKYIDTPKLIVNAGRLRKQKNQEILIYAMRLLHPMYPDLLLKIYGEGPEYKKLSKLIYDFNLENVVELAGRTEGMKEIYKNADIFVLSSNFEGMPNALMEAMAMGVPCISTDCSTGPKDLIRNMENGILVPVGNIEELVSSIKTLYSNRDLRRKIGNNAHIDMEKSYSTDVIISSLCDKLDRYM